MLVNEWSRPPPPTSPPTSPRPPCAVLLPVLTTGRSPCRAPNAQRRCGLAPLSAPVVGAAGLEVAGRGHMRTHLWGPLLERGEGSGATGQDWVPRGSAPHPLDDLAGALLPGPKPELPGLRGLGAWGCERLPRVGVLFCAAGPGVPTDARAQPPPCSAPSCCSGLSLEAWRRVWEWGWGRTCTEVRGTLAWAAG